MNITIAMTYSFWGRMRLPTDKLDRDTVYQMLSKLHQANFSISRVSGTFVDSTIGHYPVEHIGNVDLLIIFGNLNIERDEYEALQYFIHSFGAEHIIVVSPKDYCLVPSGDDQCSRHGVSTGCTVRDTQLWACLADEDAYDLYEE
jgi:hypothetical protein